MPRGYLEFIACQFFNHPVSIEHHDRLGSDALRKAQKNANSLCEPGSREADEVLSRLRKRIIDARGRRELLGAHERIRKVRHRSNDHNCGGGEQW